MSSPSYIVTLLPRSFNSGVVYLRANEFKEIYTAYLHKARLFLERYYAISLAFCTEIYAGEQYTLFPKEWEEDMTLLYNTPSLFLGAIELQDSTLLQLQEMSQIDSSISDSLLEFLQLARDLSLPRTHFNPLTPDQSNSILKYMKAISLSNAILFNCAQKKALEVFFLSIIVDVLTGQDDLINKVKAGHKVLSTNNETCSTQKYLLNKIGFYQEIREKLISQSVDYSQQNSNNRLIEIDFGAGRGYYSAYKVIEAERTLIAIEGSLKHAEGLCEYITRIKPNEASHLNKITDIDISMSSLRVALLYVDGSTSGANIESISIPIRDLANRVHNVKSKSHIRGSVIQGSRLPSLSSSTDYSQAPTSSYDRCVSSDENKKHVYSTVGLHACGPLSVIALKMLIQKDVNSAFTVPCCYGHLTKDTFPLSDQGCNLINNFFSASEVKARFRAYHADTVPREFLTYAASDCVFAWPEVIETIQSYWARATIELARRQQFPASVKRSLDKDLKSFLCGDNDSLVTAIVTDLQRMEEPEKLNCPPPLPSIKTNPIDVEKQSIARKAIEKATLYRWAMIAHYLTRKVSGHVFETFILMDRLAWIIELTEQSSIQLSAGILPALTELSPRGFLIWGFKC